MADTKDVHVANQPTRVIDVHVANLRKMGYNSLDEWQRLNENVYIGRAQPRLNAHQSKWANQYPVKKYGLDRCLSLYEHHVTNTPSLMSSLNELKGKSLGCWCGNFTNYDEPKCHGQVLMKLINTS